MPRPHCRLLPAHSLRLRSLSPEVSAMSRTRWRLLALALLVGIVPVLASPGSVGAEPGPYKPIVLPVDETFLAPNLTRHCGVDVWVHLFGTETVSLRPSGAESYQLRLTYVFSGPGGSQTLKRIENGTITTTTSPDGTLVETITVTGQLPSPLHQVVPGHGSLSNNSGREVVQITYQYDEELGEYVETDFQVLFDAGPNDELTDADFAVICEQLA